MSFLIFSLSDDFLFEDENKKVYFLRREVLDKIAKDLKLSYFTTIAQKNSVREIYYDKNSSAVVFKYRARLLDITLEKCLVTLQCFQVDENVEVYEDSSYYSLNIRPLLQPYIRNDKAFKLAESLVNNLIERQQYIV